MDADELVRDGDGDENDDQEEDEDEEEDDGDDEADRLTPTDGAGAGVDDVEEEDEGDEDEDEEMEEESGEDIGEGDNYHRFDAAARAAAVDAEDSTMGGEEEEQDEEESLVAAGEMPKEPILQPAPSTPKKPEGVSSGKKPASKGSKKRNVLAGDDDEGGSHAANANKRASTTSVGSVPRPPAVTGLTIPFRTVKKAMKLDPDIPIVQNEAAVMVTVAAELFVKNLARESFKGAKRKGRSTIKYEDVAEARTKDPSLSFLETALP
jgi:histone H3/H4